MDNILIIGGSGFIGTNLMEYFIKQGGVALLNLDLEPPRNSAHLPYWKKVNILESRELEEHIKAFDPVYVLHMAARTDLDEKKDLRGYDANTKGVRNLIAVLGQCKSLRRVIYTSSMLVCSAGYSPVSDDDYCPPNLYGESKVIMEKLIRNAGISSYDWCIIRPTSIWGPWFGTPYRNFFDIVMAKRYFKIDARVATKTFGFVGNAVHQIVGLLYADQKAIQEKTFYIGDHPPLNINKWADEIANALGIRLKTFPLPLFKIAAWAGDLLEMLKIPFPMSSFRLNNMRTDNVIIALKDTLNVVPSTPYTHEEGIRITLDWLRNHNAAGNDG